MTHADPRLLLTFRRLQAAYEPAPSVLERLRAGLARVVEADRRRRELQRLTEMPEYLLKDVGLTRADVAGILRRSH